MCSWPGAAVSCVDTGHGISGFRLWFPESRIEIPLLKGQTDHTRERRGSHSHRRSGGARHCSPSQAARSPGARGCPAVGTAREPPSRAVWPSQKQLCVLATIRPPPPGLGSLTVQARSGGAWLSKLGKLLWSYQPWLWGGCGAGLIGGVAWKLIIFCQQGA